MRTTLSVVVAGLGLLLTAVPLVAHHAFAAEFDANKPVTLKGTVTKMYWINPHAWIHLEVKDADGKVVPWEVEGGAPNALLRRGFTKKDLLPGTEVVIQGYRSRDGLNKANGNDIMLPDGRQLFVGSVGTGSPGDK
jgi:Family of unknown function (DUF6152)